VASTSPNKKSDDCEGSILAINNPKMMVMFLGGQKIRNRHQPFMEEKSSGQYGDVSEFA
jgi:hypothetical protein